MEEGSPTLINSNVDNANTKAIQVQMLLLPTAGRKTYSIYMLLRGF